MAELLDLFATTFQSSRPEIPQDAVVTGPQPLAQCCPFMTGVLRNSGRDD